MSISVARSTRREAAKGLMHQVLADYYRAVDRGLNPAPRDLIRRHPHLATELNEFFAVERLVTLLLADWQSGKHDGQSGP